MKEMLAFVDEHLQVSESYRCLCICKDCEPLGDSDSELSQARSIHKPSSEL